MSSIYIFIIYVNIYLVFLIAFLAVKFKYLIGSLSRIKKIILFRSFFFYVFDVSKI